MIIKYSTKYRHEVIQLLNDYPDMFDTYDLKSIKDEDLDSYLHNHLRFVFIEDEVVKGFVSAEKEKDSLYWKIEWLVVGHQFSNQGIGTKLLKYMEEKIKETGCDRIYLDTSHAKNKVSENTMAFYRKNGFKKAGELPDFYEHGDSEYIFYKLLN